MGARPSWAPRAAALLALAAALCLGSAIAVRTGGLQLNEEVGSWGHPAISRGWEATSSKHSSVTPGYDEDDEDDDGMDDKSYLLLGAGESWRNDGGDEIDRLRVDADYTDPDRHHEPNFCARNRYRKSTLKAVKELPFVGLFPELQRTRRFEGSGVAFANGRYWVIFDSLMAIGKVDLRFSFRGPENGLVRFVGNETESQFEGITYSPTTDTFWVLQESMQHDEHGLVPVTYELKIAKDETTYHIIEQCPVRFQLQDTNKGFESMYYFDGNKTGVRYMLGMCESNYCKTIVGPDAPGLQRGNGRVVWAQLHAPQNKSDECRWDVLKVITLPPEIYFLDYSAFSFYGYKGRDVAITSQEDAAVWVGQFDWDAMEFVPGGKIYHFPRSIHCDKIYCNIEGVAWIDGERLVFASDKSKKIQDFHCMEKDQTVHIMALP